MLGCLALAVAVKIGASAGALVGSTSRRCLVRLRLPKVGRGDVDRVEGTCTCTFRFDVVGEMAKGQRVGVSRCACVEVESGRLAVGCGRGACKGGGRNEWTWKLCACARDAQ